MFVSTRSFKLDFGTGRHVEQVTGQFLNTSFNADLERPARCVAQSTPAHAEQRRPFWATKFGSSWHTAAAVPTRRANNNITGAQEIYSAFAGNLG